MSLQRRTAKYAPPAAASSSKVSAKPASKPAEKPASKPAATLGTKDKESTEENASGRSTPQSSAGTSTLKRSDSKPGAKKDKASSDIFKSFAKAKPKAKESTPAPVEDGMLNLCQFPHYMTNMPRTNARHVRGRRRSRR